MKLVGVCLLCALCGASAKLRSTAGQPPPPPLPVQTEAAPYTADGPAAAPHVEKHVLSEDTFSAYVPDAVGTQKTKPLPPNQKVASVANLAQVRGTPSSSDKAALAKLGLPADLASTVAALASKSEAKKPAGNSTPPAAAGHRAKLDVGFKGFEAKLVAEVSDGVRNATKIAPWTDAMREQFVKNTTESLSANLKEQLAPLKASIGKTWMALPQDEQKNELVSTFRNSFESVFDGSLQTFKSHMKLFLGRIKTYSAQKISNEALVTKCEKAFSDSLIAEHCYDNKGVTTVLKRTTQAPKKNATAAEDKHKFCIQSVMTGVAKRLHDTEDLVSMSARFEAGAMSLAQKEKVDDAAVHK